MDIKEHTTGNTLHKYATTFTKLKYGVSEVVVNAMRGLKKLFSSGRNYHDLLLRFEVLKPCNLSVLLKNLSVRTHFYRIPPIELLGGRLA